MRRVNPQACCPGRRTFERYGAVVNLEVELG